MSERKTDLGYDGSFNVIDMKKPFWFTLISNFGGQREWERRLYTYLPSTNNLTDEKLKWINLLINLMKFSSAFRTHSIILSLPFALKSAAFYIYSLFHTHLQVPDSMLIFSLFGKSVWILILITILIACMAHAILLTLIDGIECKYHI